MSKFETVPLAALQTPEIQDTVDQVREHWQTVPYDTVAEWTDAAETIEPTERTSRAIIVNPAGEIDESQTIVLSLPHLNSWDPHHNIRARVMQQIVAPHSRVVVLPNNSYDQRDNYNLQNLTIAERGSMSRGEFDPFGNQQIRTLEKVQERYQLGAIMLTGYSHGGLTAISMAGQNKDRLPILAVNADEIPSKKDRTPRQLGRDFISSGGSLGKAIKEADIPALSTAMRGDKLAIDLAKFGLMNFSNDGKLMKAAMSQDAGFEIFRASDTARIPTKIGFVEGSKIFDASIIQSPCLHSANLRFVRYIGGQKHATGDNVINHALMVRDGLIPTR